MNDYSNYKECIQCKRFMSVRYIPNICPICEEINLFREVRDYIRENEVNAFQVADKFNLPLEKVKTWIRCGKIEYKGRARRKEEYFCLKCGKALFKGSYCPQCEQEAIRTIGMEYQKILETGIIEHMERRKI